MNKVFTALSVCFLLFCSISSIAQEENNDFYLVEFEKFSPPVQDIVRVFEQKKATPFMAADIYGKEHFLGNYKGKSVLLWFWSMNDGLSISQIASLNDIKALYRGSLEIISFGIEDKEPLAEFRKTNPIDFPILPKGKVFGEAAYAADLGLGRLFLIDKQGQIQKVFPRQAFESNASETFKFLKDLIRSIQ